MEKLGVSRAVVSALMTQAVRMVAGSVTWQVVRGCIMDFTNQHFQLITCVDWLD